MTARQIRLFYKASLDHERRMTASRIREINAGMAGGKDAQKIIDELLNVRND